MPDGDGKGCEDFLKKGLVRKGSPAAGKPVRLSDLAPPAAPSRPAPVGPPAPGRLAAPSVPSRPPGPPPQTPVPARPTAPPADAVARLRAEFRKSEDARRRAEARVAELEREIVELRASVSVGAQGNGNGHAETERLRRELGEAHTIIRAIEEAYLAGGGEAAPEPPVL